MSKEQKTYLLQSWKPLLPPDKLKKDESNKVELTGKTEDFNCVFLATRGIKIKRIAFLTGLSVGQVLYRLGKAHFKMSEFRDGRGTYSVLFKDMLNKEGARQMTNVLRQVIADAPKQLNS